MNLEYTGFGPLSAQVLLSEEDGGHDDGMTTIRQQEQQQPDQRRTLEVLYLSGCDNLSGQIVQQMLCSFPNLKRFHGPNLTDKDILADPRPWICNGLERLELTFGLVAASSELQCHQPGILLEQERLGIEATFKKADNLSHNTSSTTTSPESSYRDSRYRLSTEIILDQLALLSRLEELYTTTSEQERISSLELRSDLMFGKLKTLTRLKQVTWANNQDRPLSLKEAQWMLETWPVLDSVWVHRMTHVDPEAIELFKSHSILVQVLWD